MSLAMTDSVSSGQEQHTHRRGRSRESRRQLTIVLILTATYMIVEALGGWWTGSLALLADAGHALADVAALALMAVRRAPGDTQQDVRLSPAGDSRRAD